jgi:hypothetical protein
MNRLSLFFGSCLFCLYGGILSGSVLVGIEPFINQSSFNKSADVGDETANFFCTSVRKGLPPELEAVLTPSSNTNGFSCTYRVKGVIKKFNLSSFGIFSYGRAGFSGVIGEVALEAVIFSNGRKIFETTARSKKNSKDLGFTILGGPGGSDEMAAGDYGQIQERGLKDKRFGSSVLGNAYFACVSNLAVNVRDRIESKKKDFFTVIDVVGDLVYIDMGKDQGVRINEIFRITGINAGDRQAEIRIIEVLSENLSKGLRTTKKYPVKKGDRVERK